MGLLCDGIQKMVAFVRVDLAVLSGSVNAVLSCRHHIVLSIAAVPLFSAISQIPLKHALHYLHFLPRDIGRDDLKVF